MTLYIRWFALAALAAGSLSASVQDQDGVGATDRTPMFSPTNLMFSGLPPPDPDPPNPPKPWECPVHKFPEYDFKKCSCPPCKKNADGRWHSTGNPSGTAADLPFPRVRREWREHTEDEIDRYACALNVMSTISTEAGRKCYGRTYVYFPDIVMKHACVASDPRGDQGHRGPEFMLFHKSTLLTYEGSILAIDPKIGAIPWWNLPLDSAPVLNVDGTVNVSAGKYYCPNASSLPFGVGSPNDDPSVANPGCDPEKYIWSDTYFGEQLGSGPNYEVTNGRWRYRTMSRWGDFDTTYWSRDDKHDVNNECIVNMWTKVLRPVPSTVGRTIIKGVGKASNILFGGSGRSQQDSLIRYTQHDFDACANSNNTRNWIEWQNCQEENEFGTLEGVYCPDEKETCTQQDLKKVYALHSTTHDKLGEIGDVTTSPSDPALFFSYHAYIDKNFMAWQESMMDTGRMTDPVKKDLGHHDKSDPPDLTNKNYFGYPRQATHEEWLANVEAFEKVPFIEGMVEASNQGMELRGYVKPVEDFKHFDLQQWIDLLGIHHVHAGVPTDDSVTVYDGDLAHPNFLGPACSSATNVLSPDFWTLTNPSFSMESGKAAAGAVGGGGGGPHLFNPTFSLACTSPQWPSPKPGSLTYNLTQGARTHSTLGTVIYMTQYHDTKYRPDGLLRGDQAVPTLPWIPGTLLQDIANGGMPFRDIFPGYDGGRFGYSNKEIMEWGMPCRNGRVVNDTDKPCSPYSYSAVQRPFDEIMKSDAYYTDLHNGRYSAGKIIPVCNVYNTKGEASVLATLGKPCPNECGACCCGEPNTPPPALDHVCHFPRSEDGTGDCSLYTPP
ncbi:hypothetical protein EMIHUDRAFT_100598 [Emiliania huxleyi CCMP1516]|uniref:Tyrosinase copper-binding domain-containing protein n=2 Tax=Emiliania huxleyi TaxID=2903 RepID=A0A0D3JST8_EMIH1|nr:hypothetical protein EMIHUDRAFT_100598 [Emiliania huxleyi CCMP1516]EOD26573.1 hypothetical protein EMIHUDRAFT_100598 [Emiliania huxleyi CCMP1516]|eukprot:XP_005779002.1 hypothetical protein EMIHUDRAFT_100598 [Emiliania huxleyi CCMP1516]